MGGRNYCPDTAEMDRNRKIFARPLRGLVPAALSHDELEFYVKEPVGNKSRAMNLAFEQYAFCPDRVDQCEEDGSIGKLADGLTKSSLWYFWWD